MNVSQFWRYFISYSVDYIEDNFRPDVILTEGMVVHQRFCLISNMSTYRSLKKIREDNGMIDVNLLHRDFYVINVTQNYKPTYWYNDTLFVRYMLLF